jgi:hypothetical protein
MPEFNGVDMVCNHGVAMDVHCCGCHSGFLFDIATCVCLGRQKEPTDVILTGLPDACPVCGARWSCDHEANQWD